MRLNKNVLQMLKEMEGEELFFRDWGVVMVEYPYVWHRGEKIKLTQKQWKELYDGYWNNMDNDGYWIKKQAMEEFGLA